MVELKEISELAKFLTNEESCGDCCACVFGGICYERLTAERLYNEGWRKQRVGEWQELDICAEDMYCSVCGAIAPVDCEKEKFYKSNFCPNCGARMKGGE